MKNVLIVDDDIDISELISLILKKENITSKIVNDPSLVPSLIRKEHYDLIMLDIMMPGITGTELCAKIRNLVTCPIIFVTAKTELIDKMIGYEIGGDDYITKPFDNTELILKIKSLLRLKERSREITSENLIISGSIILNKDSYEVIKDGEKVNLTTREFELLRYFMENMDIALSKEQIFEAVWGSEYGDIGTVAVNIKSLRDKLNDHDKYIKTVWGYGYKFLRYSNE